MAKLGDFISPTKNIKCGDGKYPVLSMTMHDGIVLQSDRFKKSLASADRSGYKVVDYGQLVVGFPIDEGVLYLQRVIEQGIMSPAYNVWDVDYSHVDPSYFELSLHSPQAMQYYKENLRGSTARRRSLPKEVLLELPLKMPSMDEQKRVATSIDKLTHLIDMRSKQLDKQDELVKSRFIEMFGEPGSDNFGWGLIPLGEVCQINPKKNHDNRLHDGLVVSFVPMSAVSEDGQINASETKSYEEVRKGFTYFAENDVLFAKITPCMENGKGAVAKGLVNQIGFGSTEFHIIRPIKGKTNSIWVYELTVLKNFRMDAFDNMTGSAGQKRVPASFLENYKVSLPPLDLQNQFADFVAQVDKSKLAVQKSLEQLEILKKALIQEYFG